VKARFIEFGGGGMFMADTKEPNLKGRSLPREEWPAEYLRPLPASPVREPDVASVVDGNWYPVCAEPKHEKLARDELAEKGLIPYLPLERVLVNKSYGKIKPETRAMFTGYLFVKCLPTPTHWSKITSARGVRWLMMIDGAPPVVPPGAIELVRLVEAEDMEAEFRRIQREQAEIEHQREIEAGKQRALQGLKSQILWHFSEGDRVRIKSGPFAGFYADLTSAVDGHDRVKALISILGGVTPLEISAFNIARQPS
jgi:transcription antitermination factor NusG